MLFALFLIVAAIIVCGSILGVICYHVHQRYLRRRMQERDRWYDKLYGPTPYLTPAPTYDAEYSDAFWNPPAVSGHQEDEEGEFGQQPDWRGEVHGEANWRGEPEPSQPVEFDSPDAYFEHLSSQAEATEAVGESLDWQTDPPPVRGRVRPSVPEPARYRFDGATMTEVYVYADGSTVEVDANGNFYFG